MSARATAYILGLEVCPNGETITRTEKMVGVSLADSHQERKAGSRTFPALETIAQVAMVSVRTCQRLLESLERKGIIQRVRPKNQGRGAVTFYYFCELDELPEGCHGVTLSPPPLFFHKGDKRVTEGCQKGDIDGIAIDNRELKQQEQQEQKQTPPNPLVTEGECGEEELADDGKTQDSPTDLERIGVLPTANQPAEMAGNSAGCTGQRVDPRADRGAQRVSGDFDRRLPPGVVGAVDQVMQGCAFTARRLRPALAAVIQQQADKGEPPPTTALAMIAAWKSFTNQGERVRFKWGARRFFAEGYWRNSESWPWDAAVLRDEHVRAQASVGSWQ